MNTHLSLTEKHLKNGRLLSSRLDILPLLPKHSVGAEVGVLAGDFSSEILSVVKPKKLFLIDTFENNDWPWSHRFDKKNHLNFVRERFLKEINTSQIDLIAGKSQEVLKTFSKQSLDWIYIDGDHSYDAVKSDLTNALEVLKPNGWIILNDYTITDPWGGENFGTIPAINEFCINQNWQILYFAFGLNMFCDVVLSKIDFNSIKPSKGHTSLSS